MAKPIIEVKDLTKAYRLGTLGAKSFADDIRTFWNKLRAKEELLDPKVLEQIQNEDSLEEAKTEQKNEFWALRGINFKIEPGEVVGIIGHNGAGKSTLLKVLSRITEPTSGKAILRGRVSSLLEVGTGFHPDLTGRENTYLNGAIHGMTKKEIDAKFNDIIKFAKIEKFIDTPVKRYSSGMYVRLAFSVAAHLEPEILIIDEVLAVGDAGFQQQCLAKMKDISMQGKTILFVSHIMSSVKAICDRCYILEHGRITGEGNSKSMVNRYLSSGKKDEIGGTELLDDKMFLYNTGEARLQKIRLLDNSGEERKKFLYRDPLQISIIFEVYQHLESLMISLFLCSDDGVAISYGCNNDVPDLKFSLESGKYNLNVDVDENLHPGKYCWKVALFYPNGRPICMVDSVCEFSVDRFASIEALDYPWPNSHAFRMMNTKWDLESVQ